ARAARHAAPAAVRVVVERIDALAAAGDDSLGAHQRADAVHAAPALGAGAAAGAAVLQVAGEVRAHVAAERGAAHRAAAHAGETPLVLAAGAAAGAAV